MSINYEINEKEKKKNKEKWEGKGKQAPLDKL